MVFEYSTSQVFFKQLSADLSQSVHAKIQFKILKCVDQKTYFCIAVFEKRQQRYLKYKCNKDSNTFNELQFFNLKILTEFGVLF